MGVTWQIFFEETCLLLTTMLRKTSFFRFLAIPACMVWGAFEFIALQRSRLQIKWTRSRLATGQFLPPAI